MANPGPLISAVLIVRDEEEMLPGCLASLHGLADEIVVHDTGSVDGTRDLARSAGATVIEGEWHDDFGRARTEAAQAATGTWLLIVDADERVTADPAALRARLLDPGAAQGFSVRVENRGGAEAGPGYASWGTRLVLREGARWEGVVHEQPVTDAGGPRLATMPSHELTVEHLGYAEAARVKEKAARNAALAQAEIDALAAEGHLDHGLVLHTLVNLGRSLSVADRVQDAVDTFETVRDLAAPNSLPWLEATDHLARLLLGAGYDELVVVLSEQLREGGADGRYCDWLRAQALAQLGHPGEALALVRGVDELIDPAGRSYDTAQVAEIRDLLEQLVDLHA